MKRISHWFAVAALALIAVHATEASAAVAETGILVVGTQAEVAKLLVKSGVKPVYKTVDATAVVAVALVRRGWPHRHLCKIYEGPEAKDIVRFVGHTVEGGLVLTLRTGTGLWNLSNGLVCRTVKVSRGAFGIVARNVISAGVVVVDGAGFIVKSSAEVLGFFQKLLGKAFHGCGCGCNCGACGSGGCCHPPAPAPEPAEVPSVPVRVVPVPGPGVDN